MALLQTNEYKVKARKQVAYALKTGALIRPDICTRCNSAKSIQAHHENYNKPLDVKWLCQRCHMKFHSQFQFRKSTVTRIIEGKAMALLQVRLQDNEIKTLKQLALDHDTTVSELVRQWVAEIVQSVDKVGK